MKWIHDGNGEVTTEEYEADGQKVVDLICNCEVVNGSSVNAQLIAAAPELLEALQAAMEWIDAVPNDTLLPTMPGFDRDWVDGIIAKAIGEE